LSELAILSKKLISKLRVADYRGASVAVDWPAEPPQRGRDVAREHNATSFMVIQAALAVLLSKISASSEVPVRPRGLRERWSFAPMSSMRPALQRWLSGCAGCWWR
jgi:hypothetical protein